MSHLSRFKGLTRDYSEAKFSMMEFNNEEEYWEYRYECEHNSEDENYVCIEDFIKAKKKGLNGHQFYKQQEKSNFFRELARKKKDKRQRRK